MSSKKLRRFTVFGVCEEQRHGYSVEAMDSLHAEMKARTIHRRESGSLLIIACVCNGDVKAVDQSSDGIDQQRRRLS